MNGRELAAVIDVSEASVSRYASGERQPSIEVMGRIAPALGWSLDEQFRSLQAGTYGADFKERMDARGINAARGASRA